VHRSLHATNAVAAGTIVRPTHVTNAERRCRRTKSEIIWLSCASSMRHAASLSIRRRLRWWIEGKLPAVDPSRPFKDRLPRKACAQSVGQGDRRRHGPSSTSTCCRDRPRRSCLRRLPYLKHASQRAGTKWFGHRPARQHRDAVAIKRGRTLILREPANLREIRRKGSSASCAQWLA